MADDDESEQLSIADRLDTETIKALFAKVADTSEDA